MAPKRSRSRREHDKRDRCSGEVEVKAQFDQRPVTRRGRTRSGMRFFPRRAAKVQRTLNENFEEYVEFDRTLNQRHPIATRLPQPTEKFVPHAPREGIERRFLCTPCGRSKPRSMLGTAAWARIWIQVCGSVTAARIRECLMNGEVKSQNRKPSGKRSDGCAKRSRSMPFLPPRLQFILGSVSRLPSSPLSQHRPGKSSPSNARLQSASTSPQRSANRCEHASPRKHSGESYLDRRGDPATDKSSRFSVEFSS
jgi:hypothetical protein